MSKMCVLYYSAKIFVMGKIVTNLENQVYDCVVCAFLSRCDYDFRKFFPIFSKSTSWFGFSGSSGEQSETISPIVLRIPVFCT